MSPISNHIATLLRWAPGIGLSCALFLAPGCKEPWETDDDTGGGDDDTGDDDTGDDDTVDDGSCDEEMPAEPIAMDPECAVLQPYQLFEPNQDVEWQWTGSAIEPDHTQVVATPMVINLDDDNGDGAIDHLDVADVIFQSQPYDCYICGVVRAVSGVDGSELWSADAEDLQTYSNGQLAAGDLLPGIPGPEIILMGNSNEVLCLDRQGNELWRTPVDDSLYQAAPALHDMDGDGSVEVIIGRTILTAQGDLRAVGAYGAGSNETRGMYSFAVDLDDDGQLEIVASNAYYDIDGNAECTNGQDDGYPGVADFDLDGDPEVVVVSSGTIRLQDHLCNVVWGPVSVPGGGRGGPPTIADFDGDGFPEIGSANNNYYTVVDTDGSILWSHPTIETSSGATGSSVFDFNGDGTAEVVYADEQNLYIFEGPDGTVLLEESGHSNRTQFEYPTIVDIDGDHRCEIVLPSCDDFEPGWAGVTVLGTDDEQGWWNARAIWNQHAFFFTNIDEDGRVPQAQEKPWLAHNSFRQNFPPNNWAGFPLPDLIVESTGPCEGEGGPTDTRLGVRVGNQGSADAAGGIAVTLYDVSGEQPELLATEYLAGATAGELVPPVYMAYDASLTNGPFEIVVDDEGQGGGVVVECDEENNAGEWP